MASLPEPRQTTTIAPYAAGFTPMSRLKFPDAFRDLMKAARELEPRLAKLEEALK